ncbi:hypothetical protein [Streptomyces xanthophaeus]|uniref:hypothetical protein n=1 Tax=Streptomyces xanthophaeus TaxID=67385 RepID=UPI0004CC9DA3
MEIVRSCTGEDETGTVRRVHLVDWHLGVAANLRQYQVDGLSVRTGAAEARAQPRGRQASHDDSQETGASSIHLHDLDLGTGGLRWSHRHAAMISGRSTSWGEGVEVVPIGQPMPNLSRKGGLGIDAKRAAVHAQQLAAVDED